MTPERPLVEVALPLPIHHTFTYSVEGERPPPGTRVLVPFRRGERIGWITGPGDGEGLSRIRPVLDVLDDEPTVPPDLLRLCRWMADYYVAPLGIVLRSALPSVLTDASRDYVGLVATGEEAPTPTSDPASRSARDPASRSLTRRERRLVDALSGADGPRRVSTLRKELGMGSIWPEIRGLKRAGVLRHETLPPREPSVRTRRVVRQVRWLEDLAERDEIFGRAHRQREAYELLEASGGKAELAHLTGEAGFSRSVVTGLEEKGLVEVADEEVLRDPFADAPVPEEERHVPTPDQRVVLEALERAVVGGGGRPFLLHGVTGSGKTLVYVELLRRVVEEEGRSALVLVPEISLTPQTVARFRARFGDRVAVLHSALSDGERYDAWRQLRSGEKRIAVGARSAVFAPVADLGAVVVDEEHDSSYKQSEAPRYHARDLAVMRSAEAGAVCVLGSATPSLESWANAGREKFELLQLPVRVAGRPMPPVRVVDLREESTVRASGREGRGEAGVVLSPPLVEAVRERLERAEQVILLLNRRGYSSFVQCRACGHVSECPNCSISLTFHRVTGRIVCHHCRHEEAAPARCPRCGSDELSYRGLGTEQVERIVAETFPGARIARMDVDTTSGKWSHHEILGRVGRGEVDILLGTQMIAKGLDFPGVTLVGVVNADVGIHLPDFRASERTFQLLSQVAGRTGRGERGGEVLIQTSLPDHYAVRAAVEHDYRGFAERELGEREAPSYPPHVRLVNVVLSSPDEEAAAAAAEDAVGWVRGWLARNPGAGLEVVGPAPSPIERLHGRWRWHFLFRGRSVRSVGALSAAFGRGFTPRGADVRVALDRDPVALL